MQDTANLKDAALFSANRAVAKADIQRRVISTMRPGDPVLPYAYALLRQMEQNAAIAIMNNAYCHFGGKRTTEQ